MKVLILYATVEGQTGKIARFAAEDIRKRGHEAVLTDAESRTELVLDGIDAVILAAPVHQRRHPRNFEALIAAKLDELSKRPVLMLSVSLNAAFAEGRDEAADYLLEMKMRTGLKPDAEMLVPGAVRTGEYDYFAMQVVRYVVMRNRDYDRDAAEHEFTDWDALTAKIDAFLGD